jgi:hypothetical protein
MEVIFGVAIVVAAAYAITNGIKGAGKGASRAYRKRAASWRSKHPRSGSGPVWKAAAAAGELLAAGAAALLAGGVEAGRGAKAGWRDGWRKGRARGEAWRQRREEARQQDTERDEAANRDTGPIPHVEKEEDQPTVQEQPAEPAADTDTAPSITSTEGHEPMPTSSRTSGEVLTMEQLQEELQAIRDDAGAELEDAQADQKRARDDVTRMDNIQASLETLNLDGKTLADIAALGETAQLRAQAADQRAAAADARAAQAAATYQGVQARHGTLFEAYQNTQQPADQQFYKAS